MNMKTVWFSWTVYTRYGNMPCGVPVEFTDEELRAAGLPDGWSGGSIDDNVCKRLLGMRPDLRLQAG